ncbi:glycosyltransferase family 87 protein [Emcibacter sp. SYSU 3D8]|uniref:glycosyltransferase family 87 protein n=1 Tax=Emcibacter sp. SYSU 3D8 TaxID=3133969 RepID=UPI0031FEF883
MTRERVLGYAVLLVVINVLVLGFFAIGTHGLIVPLDKMPTTDFASFYAAGSLAADGTPHLAYDQAAHLAAERRATFPDVDYLYFYYPPVFLLVCVVLGFLPYLPAFYVFQFATLAPFLLVARKTLGETGWAGWVLALASPAAYWAFGLGQNSFLTAALFGGALLLVDRRPVLAGLLFGLVCYKPHFGLLIPVALAAGGNWRAFAGATFSLLAVAALSLGIFGYQTWHDYIALATGAHGSYEDGIIDLAAFVTPFGGARLVGIPVPLAYALQGLMTVAAAVAVGFVWWKRLSLPVRAAVLASAALVAVPVALMYDMVLSTLAIFWLVRAARSAGGFMPWEKSILALVFITPALSRVVGIETGIPMGPLAQIALLGVAMARAWLELAGRGGSARGHVPAHGGTS